MTNNKLIVFIIFRFNFLFNTLEVDNIDNVSQELSVSHSDCTKKQDNRMYSLNKLAECKVSPENLYIASATNTLYQKNYLTDLSQQNVLSRSTFLRYNSGMFFRTSYVHDKNSFTYDMIVTPKMCRLASKSIKIKVKSFDEKFDVLIEFDVKT